MRDRRALASWLLVTLSLLVTAPAVAQARVQVQVAPRLGIVDPGDRLYGATARTAADGIIRSAAAMEGSPSIGAAVRVGNDSLGAFLHLSIDHAPSTAADLAVYEHGETWLWPPSPVVTYRSIHPATLTELGADLVLPLHLRFGPLRPFVTGGIGLTRYRFSEPEPAGPLPALAVPPESGYARAQRLGGGFDFELGGRGLSLTVLNAFGGYYGGTAHRWIASAEVWFDVRE